MSNKSGEIDVLVGQKKKALVKLKLSTSDVKHGHKVRLLKKEIARLLTEKNAQNRSAL